MGSLADARLKRLLPPNLLLFREGLGDQVWGNCVFIMFYRYKMFVCLQKNVYEDHDSLQIDHSTDLYTSFPS